MTSLTIPATVTKISNEDGAWGITNPFLYYSDFAECIVDPANPYYTSRDGVLFNKDMTEILCCPPAKQGAYTIPDGVKYVGGFFRFNLTDIVVPDSVISLGGFGYSTSLKHISLGAGITGDDYAFGGCTSLVAIDISEDNPNFTSADGIVYNKDKTKMLYCPRGKEGICQVPEGVQQIGDEAFTACTKLERIDIPKTVTAIGSDYSVQEERVCDVFRIGKGPEYEHCCKSLTAIEVDPENPVYSSKDGALFNKDQSTLLLYPGNNAKRYTIPDTVTRIAEGAFYCIDQLTIIIPKKVTRLDGMIWNSYYYHYEEYNPMIYCYANSAAEQYAIEEEIPYRLIVEEDSLQRF